MPALPEVSPNVQVGYGAIAFAQALYWMWQEDPGRFPGYDSIAYRFVWEVLQNFGDAPTGEGLLDYQLDSGEILRPTLPEPQWPGIHGFPDQPLGHF